MYCCFSSSSNLPTVCQAGGGLRLGSTRHGCLREGDGSRWDWRETPHVQHLHQESSWNIWSHLYQSNLPESHRGHLALVLSIANKEWVITKNLFVILKDNSFLLLQVLPDEHARDMCQRFADMESKLGEIDRARAIYSYCSQICDPRVRLTLYFRWVMHVRFSFGSWISGIVSRWLPTSGKAGKNLKSATGTKTPFGRCWGLNVASRPPTTPRSTSCPRRCWRPQPAPRAPVRTR